MASSRWEFDTDILDIVMKYVAQAVNFIKLRSVNNRIFSHMCSDTGTTCINFIILRSGGCQWGNVLVVVASQNEV